MQPGRGVSPAVRSSAELQVLHPSKGPSCGGGHSFGGSSALTLCRRSSAQLYCEEHGARESRQVLPRVMQTSNSIKVLRNLSRDERGVEMFAEDAPHRQSRITPLLRGDDKYITLSGVRLLSFSENM